LKLVYLIQLFNLIHLDNYKYLAPIFVI